jgi:hypothetical protein
LNSCFENPAVTHRLIEILGNNFSYEEIILIGQRNENNFHIHVPDNHYGRLRLQPHVAAEYLATYFKDNSRIEDIVRFLIDIDCGSLNGRDIYISGFEDLMVALRHAGIGYDFTERDFFPLEGKECKDRWEECLKENKEYEFSFVSVDVVDSSQLSIEEQRKKLDQTFDSLHHFITMTAFKYNGSLWSWQGDGGILAFWGKSFILNGFFFCFEILGLLPVFNLKDCRIGNDLKLRFGIDWGAALYKKDKGSIISKNINFASHLEKKYTDSNSITISENVYSVLNEKQKSYFEKRNCFDGKDFYCLIQEKFNGVENKTPHDNNRTKRRDRVGNSRRGLVINR